MRVVLTGGAGFIGSHLCAALLDRGDEVLCIDDLSTGRQATADQLTRRPGFTFLRKDVCRGLSVAGTVDAVVHLASPASPPDYQRRPLETLAAGSRGTEHALQLADRHRARFLLASTSEVYGDPLVHPQREDYWGNVNPVGPRSVYDEAKRYAEAVTMAHRRVRGTDVGVVRIFNTYGPHMRSDDGRVVTTFITQALSGRPLTIHGDGSQTRSFCYVDDLVRGLTSMLDSGENGPINLGNPTEHTVSELAGMVLDLTGSPSRIEYHPLPVDDPTRRCPVIDRARERLQWSPRVGIEEGLRRTIAWLTEQPPGADGGGPGAGARTGGQRLAPPYHDDALLRGTTPGHAAPAVG